MKHFNCLGLILLFLMMLSAPSFAACVNPAGSEGDQIYNTTENKMQYCNDTDWIDMSGGDPGGGGVGDELGNHKATTDLNMNNMPVVNLGAQSSAQDIARKAYIDGKTGANETDPQVGAVTNGYWCQSNGTSVQCDVSGIGTSLEILYAVDMKLTGTGGGAGTNSAWTKRDITNLVYTNLTGASLSSNEITLPAGTYYADITVPFMIVGEVATRLAKVSDSSVLLNGTSEYLGTSNTDSDIGQQSVIRGTFVLPASTAVKIEYYKTNNHNTVAAESLGQPGTYTGPAMYTTAYFVKVASDNDCYYAGLYIPDGDSVDLYSKSSSSDCAARQQTRTCSAGVLGGDPTYQYSECTDVPCGGTTVAGYCWYSGSSGGSCTSACASHGGYHEATRNYAGDLGNPADCKNLFDILGFASGTMHNNGSTALGCVFYDGYTVDGNNGRRYRDTGGPTTAGGSQSSRKRVCACEY